MVERHNCIAAKGVTLRQFPILRGSIGSSSMPSFVFGLKPLCIVASRLDEGGGKGTGYGYKYILVAAILDPPSWIRHLGSTILNSAILDPPSWI